MPSHEITPNYAQGMLAIRKNNLKEAVEILTTEAEDSPCYGLALGNAALALIRLNRPEMAELFARKSVEAMNLNCPHPPSGVQVLRNLAEAISLQGRHIESLSSFNLAGATADALANKYPEMKNEIMLEKAHVLNSWGGVHLQLNNPKIALEIFQIARTIHSNHRIRNNIGLIEVLTSSATAYRNLRLPTQSELCLIEANDILKKDGGTNDQLHLIQVGLIQLGSSEIDIKYASLMLNAAAEDAYKETRLGTAYLRWLIAADWAYKNKKIDYGLMVIKNARELESKLEPSDPHTPRLRITEIQLLSLKATPKDHIIKLLIEGAYLWYSKVDPRLIHNDVIATIQSMHDHFRFLSTELLALGRVEDALVAFESGRALAYTIEINQSVLNQLPSICPFSKDGNFINTDLIRQVQNTLKDDEILLIPSLLPPNIVSFIVSKNSVTSISVPLPPTEKECVILISDIEAVPERLHSGVGIRAIPEIIQLLANKLAGEISSRKIRAVMPYSKLHLIPWRLLLNNFGIAWNQLNCGTEFGLITHSLSQDSLLGIPSTCIALGHGHANAIDLNDEAEKFSEIFGENGKLIKQCTSRDVTHALSHDTNVLISCHGSVNSKINDGHLTLEFSDGEFPSVDIFPDKVVSPLVILSACQSGVYNMQWSDYPEGAAPDLLRLGAKVCIATRFPVGAQFAQDFIHKLSKEIFITKDPRVAFSNSLAGIEKNGADRWRDLACFEILIGNH